MDICFIGYAGNGKTFLANTLVENLGYVRMSFAAPVKEIAVEIHNTQARFLDKPPITREELEANKKRYRKLLQVTGTELGRDMFGKNVWVDKLSQQLDRVEAPVVVDDVRFMNELNTLLDKGFFPVCVHRFPSQDTHESEQMNYETLKKVCRSRNIPFAVFSNLLPPEESQKKLLDSWHVWKVAKTLNVVV